MQLRQVELGQRRRGGRHAEHDGERVLGDAELLTQGRAQCRVAGELALGSDDVEARDRAGVECRVHELEVLAILLEDGVHGGDLGTQRGDPQRLHHGVAGHGQPRRVELLLLHLGKRALLLDRARRAAGVVEGVAHRGTDREIAEGRRLRQGAEKLFAVFLAPDSSRRTDLRRQRAGLRVGQLLRLRQGRRRGRDRGAVRERAGDDVVERGRPEATPPFGPELGTRLDVLGSARGRRGSLDLQGLRGIAVGRRRLGPREVRADGTGGQRGRGGKAKQTAKHLHSIATGALSAAFTPRRSSATSGTAHSVRTIISLKSLS